MSESASQKQIFTQKGNEKERFESAMLPTRKHSRLGALGKLASGAPARSPCGKPAREFKFPYNAKSRTDYSRSCFLAEKERFELSRRFNPTYTLSRGASSAS